MALGKIRQVGFCGFDKLFTLGDYKNWYYSNLIKEKSPVKHKKSYIDMSLNKLDKQTDADKEL